MRRWIVPIMECLSMVQNHLKSPLTQFSSTSLAESTGANLFCRNSCRAVPAANHKRLFLSFNVKISKVNLVFPLLLQGYFTSARAWKKLIHKIYSQLFLTEVTYKSCQPGWFCWFVFRFHCHIFGILTITSQISCNRLVSENHTEVKY